MSTASRTADRPLACIVMAGGKGTRMRSALPKVLHPIWGRPLLGWVIAAVREAGGTAVLVADDVASGTDRVKLALDQLDPDGRHDVVVNLQGDFPTLAPDLLRAVLLPLADRSVDIGSLVTPIADAHEAATESFVKCACAFLGEAEVAPALYFSRTAIPWGAGPLWHHIGVYAYRRAALARFVSLPPSQLELREKL